MVAADRPVTVLAQALAVLAAVLLTIALLPLASGAQQQQQLCSDPPEAPFADRDQIAEVHVRNVDCVYDLGITQGRVEADGQRYFHPTANISRGQFAAFLFRTLEELGKADELPPPQQPQFSDVPPTHTFYEEIHRLAAAEIILGYSDGRFGPNDPVRRDQTASLLLRAAEWVVGEEITAEDGPYFSDTEGNVHADNIDAAFEAGFVVGRVAPTANSQGIYAPAELTTRQQMATVIVRFLRELGELTATPSPTPTPTETDDDGSPLDPICDQIPLPGICPDPEPSPST